MSEDFEEFLKKWQNLSEWNKYYIRTKDLGEWAWQWAIVRIPTSEMDNVEQACQNLIGGRTLTMAVACLGKEEIEKRLKAWLK